MKQEDKEFLLKDLCSRLPYGVNVITNNDSIKLGTIVGISSIGKVTIETKHADVVFWCNEIKPYLRPMSSMTEEERLVLSSKCELTTDVDGEKVWSVKVVGYDWLNAHHFDYRGLIEKNLALEAPEGMYK